MFKKLRERQREYDRRFERLQDQVREEPGELDDGTPVVFLVVDDEPAWRRAWDDVAEMGSWPLYRGRRRGGGRGGDDVA